MSSPQIFLVGAAGQLGTALLRTSGDRVVRPLTSRDVDVSDPHSVRLALADLRADDLVINASAYTAVDAAQTDAARAAAVNVDGPANLAAAVAGVGARLIHVSTDYVFAGVGHRPFEPDDVAAEPATVYGATKLAGERAARAVAPDTLIVRTAWVFTGAVGGSDFVSTMRRLEGEREVLRVVDDQTGSPTYAPDLASALWSLADRRGEPALADGGVLHAVNSGVATWNALARAVFSELGADPERVQRCTTEEFPRPAPRPAYSVLSTSSWSAVGLPPLRPWRDALHDALTTDPSGHGATDTLSR